MQKGQIVIGVGALILVFTLYFLGKTVQKKEQLSTPTLENFSFDQYEQLQLSKLSSEQQKELLALKAQIKSIKLSDTTALKALYLKVSDLWKNSGNLSMGAYNFYRFAKIGGSKADLENAGDVLVNAYKSGPDSTISNNLITFALRSYEEAIGKDGSDVGLRIKLAEVYVQGSQEPMKGVGILRQLVDSLPDNVPVLLALGRLSIQSGQFDKAKERLQKVLKIQPQNTEALYFMAITEAQMGHNDEAVRLFEMCKLIVADKNFNKEIDEIVKSLKSKKV